MTSRIAPRIHAAGKVSMSLLTVILTCVVIGSAQQQTPRPQACDGAGHRQFDFWIGDWDVFEAEGAVKAAQVRVSRILDGCVLHEQYEGSDGLRGESFSIYDASRNVWHQTWVTNRGQLLAIEGQWQDGAMVLGGPYRSETGERGLVRGRWKPASDGLRETAARSRDHGKTWTPWFDLVFRPRSKSAPANDDPRVIAALDKEYQAAVKINDAATMDRLLVDEFVLVTGNGRIYTKADLLAEARSGTAVYEQQDELEQVVRVWGDTAVVTAKLWEKGTSEGRPFDYRLWFS